MSGGGDEKVIRETGNTEYMKKKNIQYKIWIIRMMHITEVIVA